MIKSMTGYGRAEALVNGRDITVEIKSVNSRYFEYSSRIHRSCAYMDDKLKKLLSAAVSRGKVELSLQMQTVSAPDVTVQVNMPLAKSYAAALEAIRTETGAAGDIQTGAAVSPQQAAQDGLGQQGAQQMPFRREAAGDAQGQAAAVFQKPVQGGIIFQNLAQQAYAFGQNGQQAVPVHGGGGSGRVPGKRGRTSATGPHGGPPGPGDCGGAGDVPPTVVPCRPPLVRP